MQAAQPDTPLPVVSDDASFAARAGAACGAPLAAEGLEVLQLQIIRQCNLACRHCHVAAGPDRREIMSRATLETCLCAAEDGGIPTVDITGGAPELHPDLTWFLERVSRPGRRVIVRSNLTLLREPPHTGLVARWASRRVEVIGSLPDFRRERAERQRGSNTFARAIEALRELNRHGYGKADSGLTLHLVHNPVGAYLPAAQTALEGEYRARLLAEHGVVFNRLYCLTNVPLGRYLEFLERSGNADEYRRLLRQAFNPATARRLMCRTLLSVGWDGRLYDCDFNQMLGLSVARGAPQHIRDFDGAALRRRVIAVGDHCFACAAGAGSSCQGALETNGVHAGVRRVVPRQA